LYFDIVGELLTLQIQNNLATIRLLALDVTLLYYNQLMREALHLEQVDEWLQDCFEFVELAVHPQYQNKGLGTKLHNELLEGLSNRTSVLTTQINNEKARSLYERLDWVNVLEPFHPSKNDVPYVIMGKVLKIKVN
ncbi:GNAT family N-acetyltransferase, partial [Bacillus cereus]